MISFLLRPLLKEKQFVIVQITDKVLVFLVDDIETPSVPGYPAQALEYFPNAETARKVIEETYNQLDYWPKNKGYLDIYKAKDKQ